ncbi:MAG: 4Fe-4S dicluster domain-containing protein, partial [Longimicrobiales bacterium]
PMLGSRIVAAFGEIKTAFDPSGTLNPGKIVNPSRMDDRTLMRYRDGYGPLPVTTALDWSTWGGWVGATEMCNNNGACRKTDPGVMCPSFRATGDERHTTRGRANSLRLALTGQLGADGLTSDEMYDALSLCVGCKACGKECPTGVDMARMKIEFLHHYHRKRGLPIRERLVAWLPRFAPWAARLPGLMNAGRPEGLLARAGERLLGLTARRERPRWRRDVFRSGKEPDHGEGPDHDDDRPEVLLWVDTFNTYFEPENAHAALRVLDAAGYRVRFPTLSGRPPCCGRTFLNAGLIDEARHEAERLMGALSPWVERGVPVVGLEPSCLLTLRDEIPTLLPGERSTRLADGSFLFDEFLVREAEAGRAPLDLGPVEAQTALVHTHCHQKALGQQDATETVLRRIPGLTVKTLRSGCCGMAGAFGYEAEHYEVSMAMGELDLLPSVRDAPPDTWVLAAGVSCRHQIAHGAQRSSLTLARALEASLGAPVGAS